MLLKISTPETSGQAQFTARRKNNLVRRASQGVKRYKEGKHSDDSSSDVADSDFEFSPVYSQKQKVVDGYSPEASKSGPGSDYSNPFVGDSDSNEDQWLNRKSAVKAQNSKKKKEYPYPKEKKKIERENDAELVKGPFEDHCPMCEEVIPNRKLHLMHVRTHTTLQCKLCGRVYANQRKLYEHFRNVHQNKRRVKMQHVCNICSGNFSSNNNLKVHIESVHNKTKLCMCEICGHTTYEKAALNNHIRSVHKKEKNFKCTVCEKAFFLLTHLNSHLKIHTGEKSHQCSLCTVGNT